MSKPIISDKIGGYSFIWEDENLIIDINRLNSHTDGRVTGEILLKSLKDNIPIYPQTSFNFNSSQTRSRLAKTLSELDSSYNWNDILNQLSLATIERARKGEPVQELFTSDNVPPLEFLLEPIIIKGVPNVIFGEKGVTKSTMSLVFYICLILPWTDNPLDFEVPDHSIKTLILDYELPGFIAQRNAKYIQEGMNLPAFPLYHRRCRLPLAEEIEQIANHINDIKAECIIIDSLARACGSELNKTEPANAFFEALDKLTTTSLILAQTSKDPDKKKASIYGNALFTYYARNIWELCKTNPINENEVDIALFQRESNLTKRYPNMSFKLTFNEHKNTIEKQPMNISEFIQKVSIKQAILQELKRGALSALEISENIGGSENSIKVTLNRLQRQKLVQKIESHKWGLLI